MRRKLWTPPSLPKSGAAFPTTAGSGKSIPFPASTATRYHELAARSRLRPLLEPCGLNGNRNDVVSIQLLDRRVTASASTAVAAWALAKLPPLEFQLPAM